MKTTITATKAALLRRMAQLQAEAELCYDPDRAREIVTEVTVIETILSSLPWKPHSLLPPGPNEWPTTTKTA